MRTTTVIGPVTGRPHAAYATGETWNGSPVLGFIATQVRDLIDAGDGADSNGYGLTINGVRVLDVTGPDEREDVPTVTVEVDEGHQLLYVPQGRQWDEASPNSTVASVASVASVTSVTSAASVTSVTYGTDDECTACAAHIAEPHDPRCPLAS